MTGVLLVDDEPLVLIGMQGMLNWAALGYEVVGTARNGAEALRAVQEKQPDIVVSDIRMPVMDGFEAAAAIRSSQRKSAGSIPVFAFTSSSEDEVRSEAARAGFGAVLTKPINMEQLRGLLG